MTISLEEVTGVERNKKYIQDMMAWVSNEHELAEWSGPDFRYPLDIDTFSEDLKLDTLKSYFLISNELEPLAFGQYYRRLGRCHLARLIVNPKFRGQGVASMLMNRLCVQGLKEYAVTGCSLFVLADNEKAIKAYEKFGFIFADCPEEITLDNCLYMIKNNHTPA